jgi:DNA-binding transcriptional ArsR family regulator
MEIVTVSDLSLAICNSIDESKGIGEDNADELAQHVLSFFGYADRIIDNVLEPEDRDTFYMLEDAGILTTEREETTLYDGREWRIHYWLFRKEKMRELMANIPAETIQVADEDSVYADLPDDIWRRGEE